MKMISMKRSQEEQAIQLPARPVSAEYPGGLCLYLCEDEIKKLGLKEMPEAGSFVMIQAKAMVKQESESEHVDMGVSRHLELQIVELGVKGAKKDGMNITESSKMAKKFYDDQDY